MVMILIMMMMRRRIINHASDALYRSITSSALQLRTRRLLCHPLPTPPGAWLPVAKGPWSNPPRSQTGDPWPRASGPAVSKTLKTKPLILAAFVPQIDGVCHVTQANHFIQVELQGVYCSPVGNSHDFGYLLGTLPGPSGPSGPSRNQAASWLPWRGGPKKSSPFSLACGTTLSREAGEKKSSRPATS